MKRMTKLDIQAITFWVVLLTLLVAFGFTFNAGVDRLVGDNVTSYYLSSDNAQELKAVYSSAHKAFEFTVNGQEVILLSDNRTVTPSFIEKTKDSPLLLVSLLLLLMIFSIGSVIPSQVQGRMMYYYRAMILNLFYKKAKGGKVELLKAPAGVIAVRRWGMTRNGILVSLNQGNKWDGLVFEDRFPPIVHSTAGIYAYRLGSNHAKTYNGFTKVMGLVSMTGKVISHQDHTLRGERATILFLVASSEKAAEKLRNRYYCPIIVNTNPALAIETWAMSDQGLFWQAHNSQLIKEKRVEGMVDSIESLPAYKEFQGGKK